MTAAIARPPPAAGASAIVTALRAEGIYADARGSKLRLGPAPYVTDDELDLGVAAVARLITAA